MLRPSSKLTNRPLREKGAREQGSGRSHGGLTTKINLLCDGLGRLLRLFLTGGQKADCQGAIALLGGRPAQAVIADKGYDANEVRTFIQTRKMKTVIPAKPTRKLHCRHDQQLYFGQRNLIENCFGKLKLHHRIATRFDRNCNHFLIFLYLACSLFWLN